MRNSRKIYATYSVNADRYKAELQRVIPQLEREAMQSSTASAVTAQARPDARVSTVFEIKNGVGAVTVSGLGLQELKLSAFMLGAPGLKPTLLDCPADARGLSDCKALLSIERTAVIGAQQRITVQVEGQGAKPNGRAVLVVQPKAYVPKLTELVVEKPSASARPSERDLAGYGLDSHVLYEAHASGSNAWYQVGKLFTVVPREFLIFTVGETPVWGTSSGKLPAGEPVLVMGDELLRANGQKVQLNLSSAQLDYFRRQQKNAFDEVFTATTPATLTLPKRIDEREPGGEDIFEMFQSDYATFEEVDDPRVKAHLSSEESVGACVDKIAGNVLKRFGTQYAGGRDVVTTNMYGAELKRESLIDYQEKKIRAACPVAALEKRRAALRRTLRDEAIERVGRALQ